MSYKALALLLIIITVIVYTPIIIISLKSQRSLLYPILLLVGNIIVINHFFITLREAAISADPQAGIGTSIYILGSLAVFSILTVAALLLFLFRR